MVVPEQFNDISDDFYTQFDVPFGEAVQEGIIILVAEYGERVPYELFE
jgi:hypothetical protein